MSKNPVTIGDYVSVRGQAKSTNAMAAKRTRVDSKGNKTFRDSKRQKKKLTANEAVHLNDSEFMDENFLRRWLQKPCGCSIGQEGSCILPAFRSSGHNVVSIYFCLH